MGGGPVSTELRHLEYYAFTVPGRLEGSRFAHHISLNWIRPGRADPSPQSDPVPQSGPVMEGDRHES